jgi:hypothetical protein
MKSNPARSRRPSSCNKQTVTIIRLAGTGFTSCLVSGRGWLDRHGSGCCRVVRFSQLAEAALTNARMPALIASGSPAMHPRRLEHGENRSHGSRYEGGSVELLAPGRFDRRRPITGAPWRPNSPPLDWPWGLWTIPASRSISGPRRALEIGQRSRRTRSTDRASLMPRPVVRPPVRSWHTD